MTHDKLIIKPIVTEKTTLLENSGKYVFKVLSGTNKIEIAKAIKKMFNAKVEDVNIINTADKTKRRGRTKGRVMGYKKAIVTLKKGEKIKIREEVKEEKIVKKADKKEKVVEKKTGEKKEN
uniref:Large ribosomal subunit protein uL23 n=1 Tax=candidate division CPR3 bacterium TaxID=2268181 RepID=A0A7C4M386_UNCC3